MPSVTSLSPVVPPVPAPDCPETGAQVQEKRSKCAVLEDTANAVRELRQRCEAQGTELEALRAKYEERYKATQASATRLVAEEKALKNMLVRR